ncbi:unnamed protein product [Caenorhabditis auriculariae]|uniref:Secreted protein n=1 Tax=Caenorhabditis auriculariae TaxID=2777116 RepID=A0A8S1H4H6_9PELO|nr:unnamed protein product [Caenorhabditis auriculariae]
MLFPAILLLFFPTAYAQLNEAFYDPYLESGPIFQKSWIPNWNLNQNHPIPYNHLSNHPYVYGIGPTTTTPKPIYHIPNVPFNWPRSPMGPGAVLLLFYSTAIAQFNEPLYDPYFGGELFLPKSWFPSRGSNGGRGQTRYVPLNENHINFGVTTPRPSTVYHVPNVPFNWPRSPMDKWTRNPTGQTPGGWTNRFG